MAQLPIETPTVDAAPAETAVSENAPSQDETNAGVARASGLLALGNIASRILGLAREVALSNLFGASRAVDAFNIALIIPKTIHDLLIAGHINSAIVPVLSETVAKEGQAALWRLLSVLLSIVTALMAVLVIVLQVLAPQAVALVGGGAPTATQSLAADLLRLTAPALWFLALFALASGALYALRRFTRPAFAGVLFNGTVVVCMIVFAANFGIAAAAVGWLAGALVQLALQLPGLRLTALRPTLRWRHPGVQRIALLYVPVMVSLILDTFVRTFSYNVASGTGEGSISYMNWATTLIQFPHGLVGTAISIAVLPTLARQAALMAQEGLQPFRNTLGLGLRLVITLILPATVGLYLLAQPIVALVFEHGAFTPQDTVITVQALRWYLFGLPFAALDLLLIYAFYARQDTLTPALIGFFSLLVYLLVTQALVPTLGLYSLMIADSIKHIVHSITCALLLRRRLDGMGDQRLVRTTLQTGAAAAVMGIVLVWIEPLLAQRIGAASLGQEIGLVGISGLLSVVVFVLMALLLRIAEVKWLFRLIYQRWRR